MACMKAYTVVGPTKLQPRFFEILGQGDGRGRSGQGARHLACEALRPVGGGGLEAPDVVRQRAEFAPQFQHAPGVVDGGLDLAPVAHDGRILHQAFDISRAEGGDLLGVEVRKAVLESPRACSGW